MVVNPSKEVRDLSMLMFISFSVDEILLEFNSGIVFMNLIAVLSSAVKRTYQV